MTRVAIDAETLSTYTSSTPSREMLLHMMRVRTQTHYMFFLRRGSETSGWWTAFRARIDPSISWEEIVLRHSRRAYHLMTLVGLSFQPRISAAADVYLRLDVGTMGPKACPLINLVQDLSALKKPRSSSLRWYGRILFRRHLREGAALANRTVCISRFTADDLLDLMPEISERLRVIPCGIGDEWFTDRADVAKCAAILPRRPYFIWYGYITERKNLAGLVEAYALARHQTRQPSAFPELLIVGDSSDGGANLSNMIERLGLKDSVRRVGPQQLEQLITLVAHSRGLAFPSFYEGFGLPIVEAFAQGIPVLTSNVTSMPEVAAGLADLCDPADQDSIAQGLLRLSMADRWSESWIAARKSHARSFTAARASRAYSALIDEVLREARG